jgi:hypothetical protein
VVNNDLEKDECHVDESLINLELFNIQPTSPNETNAANDRGTIESIKGSVTTSHEPSIHSDDSDSDEIGEIVKPSLKRTAVKSEQNSARNKRRRTSVYETAAETTADGMVSLGTSIKDAQLLPSKTQFDQAIEVLNGMKQSGRISSKEYFTIVRVFNQNGKEHYSALFVGMTSDLRMEWLLDEELIVGPLD